MAKSPLIVGIGGTTRAESSVEKLVRGVLTEVEVFGARTQMFGGTELAALPHYAPENPTRTTEQSALIAAVREADGLVIGTPAYHGGVSGLVKNAIDLCEDLNKDDRVYFSGLPIGLVVSAYGWQACGVTLQSMRGIAHALRGWPTPIGITVNSLEQKPFDEDGNIASDGIRQQCTLQASQIMEKVLIFN